ncbi:thioredoxin family protein [uncultured Chitinophaga sp.]|jgi:Uncharacterized protein conserved in bacteria|uniref:DUF899 domain-containing protein n=1 Tax=uncultured Chitinophaga sp. TaxID=339340 RepID=UPI0026183F44|nr:thioredoxin family protein [uncultured Chitinophaga sp.]
MHTVVSPAEWLTARKQFLEKEKQLNRLRDEVARERLSLPWERVEKQYVFEGPDGPETMADLFDGRSQLIVYHFMLGPDREEGCPSCSFFTDHIDGTLVHLANRDITLLLVSRAPYQQIKAFKERMGWQVRWVSSYGNDFNYDYHVSFRPEEIATGEVYYNYDKIPFMAEDLHGASAFYKNEENEIFHTYSTYMRGCDVMVNTYNFMDIAPLGRNEDDLGFTMSWVRHHDRYEQSYIANKKAAGQAPATMGHDCCSGGAHS